MFGGEGGGSVDDWDLSTVGVVIVRVNWVYYCFSFLFSFFNTGGILNFILSLSIKFEATATLIRLYIYIYNKN